MLIVIAFIIIALRLPRSRIARPDEPNPVPHKHVGIRPGGWATGQLPD